MKRLVLATDFSERSDRALRRAVLLARRGGTVIDLVHVIDDDRPRRIVEQEKHEAWLLLTELAGSLKSVDGVASTIRIELADPFAGILKSVRDPVPDMLVIGPRDLEAGNVSVRVHGKGHLGAKPRAEVVAEILAAIKERRA